MKDDASSKKIRWPIIISVISLIYVVIYAIFYVRHPKPQSSNLFNIWNLAICLFLFGGAVGVAFRRSGGVSLLLIGSSLVILKELYYLLLIIKFIGGPPPFFFMLGLLSMQLPKVIWPIFLIVWFLRQPIRKLVKNEWI